MIETLSAVVNAKEFKMAVSVIKLLRNALKEDVSEVLKKKIADSELQTAQSVLDSLMLESQDNWKNGINRAITHIESAFTLYNDKNEFESSCVCAMYLSVMHKAIGNNGEELHKSIWLRVPNDTNEMIRLGKYASLVKLLLSEETYEVLVSERLVRKEKSIDDVEVFFAMVASAPETGIFGRSLAVGITSALEANKYFLSKGIKNERSRMDTLSSRVGRLMSL